MRWTSLDRILLLALENAELEFTETEVVVKGYALVKALEFWVVVAILVVAELLTEVVGLLFVVVHQMVVVWAHG